MPSDNPFWFGWYPGDKPLYRNPKAAKPAPLPDFYDLSMEKILDDAWNPVQNLLEMPANLPKWAWERVKDDFKGSFKISGIASRPSGTEIYEYDAQEGADVPGVNVSLSLYDLATNPAKAISNFTKSATNPLNPLKSEFWNDLETSIQRDMYRALLKDEDPANVKGYGFSWVKDAYAARGRQPFDFSSAGVIEEKWVKKGAWDASTPLASAGTDLVIEEFDVYKDLAGNVINFQTKKKSRIVRGGAYNSMQESFVEVATAEMSRNKNEIYRLAPQTQDRVEDFLSESSLIIGKKDGFGIKLGDANGQPRGSFRSVGKALDNSTESLGKFGFGSFTQDTVTSTFTSQSAVIAEVRQNIADVRQSLQVSEQLAFDKRVKGLEKVLDKYDSMASEILSGETLTGAQAEILRGKMVNLQKEFSTTFYGGGVKSGYLYNYGREYFEGGAGKDSILEINPTGANISPHYQTLPALYLENKRDYLREEGRDLLAIIEKGKFMDTRIWTEYKHLVQVATPAYWVTETLKRTQYFGLVFDGDYEGKEFGKGLLTHKFLGKWALLKENTFDLTVGSSSVSVKGGKDLKNINTAWNSAKKGGLLAGDLSLRDNQLALFDAINGTPGASLTGGVAAANYIFGTKSSHVGDLMSSGLVFKNFLVANSGALGLVLDANGNVSTHPDHIASNLQALENFFTALGNRESNSAYYTAFANYIGRFQQVSTYLSRVQQAMFVKLGVAKYFSTYVYAKEAVVKRVSDFFTKKVVNRIAGKLSGQAVAAATGGVGELIAPFVDKAVQMAISKLEDLSLKLVRSVFKGEFVKTLSGMLEGGAKTIGKVMGCGCLFPVLLSGLVLSLASGIITTISPIDFSAPKPGAGGGAGPPGSQGSGTVVPIPPPITGQVGCFFRPSCEAVSCGRFPGCHGSDSYWAASSNVCWYSIPTFSVTSPQNMKYTSLKKPDGTPYTCTAPRGEVGYERYGYATDYVNTCGESAVYIPQVFDVTKWRLVDDFQSATVGWGVAFTSSEASSRYKMVLLHLKPSNWVNSGKLDYVVGDGVGVLATAANWTPHLHLEISKWDGSKYVPLDPAEVMQGPCSN